MRISTAALHQQALSSILLNQARLARTQNELALGTRLITAKDDPGNWARAAGLDQQLAVLAGYRSNASVAESRLGLEENALAAATETLNRVRELALQANGGTLSAADRSSVANEMRAAIDSLLSIANTDDGQGRYLFGGTEDGAPPFSLDAVGATYSGGADTRSVQIGPERSIALGDSGAAVFSDLRSGNGTFEVAAAAGNTGAATLKLAKLADAAVWDGDDYSLSFTGGNYEVRNSANALVASGAYQSGVAIRFQGVDLSFSGVPADGDRFSVTPSAPRDLFAIVQNLAQISGTSPAGSAGRAQQQTAVFGALQEIDAAMDHLSEMRGGVGHRLKAVEDALVQIETVDVQAQATLAGMRDLDYAEAATRLNLQMTALQAAQQSYSRVQGLSLFDYLR